MSPSSLDFCFSTFRFLAFDSFIFASATLIPRSFSAVVIRESSPIAFRLPLKRVCLAVTTASIAFFSFIKMAFHAQSQLEVCTKQSKYFFAGVSIAG